MLPSPVFGSGAVYVEGCSDTECKVCSRNLVSEVLDWLVPQAFCLTVKMTASPEKHGESHFPFQLSIWFGLYIWSFLLIFSVSVQSPPTFRIPSSSISSGQLLLWSVLLNPPLSPISTMTENVTCLQERARSVSDICSNNISWWKLRNSSRVIKLRRRVESMEMIQGHCTYVQYSKAP